MATREIRLGKVTGLSSYELAVQSGLFTGTLSEYLNKEQQYYNDIVTYGDQLLANINAIVKPATSNVTTTVDAAKTVVPNDTEYEVYRYAFATNAYATLSAFFVLDSTADISDATVEVYLNNTLVATSGISNNILSTSANLQVSQNDEIVINVYQYSGLSRSITNSSIQINYTERS